MAAELTDKEAVDLCIEVWFEIKAKRRERDTAKCPLERVACEAQIDALMMLYLESGRAAGYDNERRRNVAAHSLDW